MNVADIRGKQVKKIVKNNSGFHLKIKTKNIHFKEWFYAKSSEIQFSNENLIVFQMID